MRQTCDTVQEGDRTELDAIPGLCGQRPHNLRVYSDRRSDVLVELRLQDFSHEDIGQHQPELPSKELLQQKLEADHKRLEAMLG